MEFSQVIKSRYSCRKYSSKTIEREKLEEILEAGRVAPTGKNLQGQRVYVIESEENLKKVDSLTPCRFGAPTVLAIAYDVNEVYIYPGGKKDAGTEDATIVATHMMLAAKNAGIDSCMLNYFDPEEAEKVLAVPENEKLVMLLDLGYAADEAKPAHLHFKRKPLEETVRYM